MSKPIVAVVGRPNVGKSTLFNRLAGERISIVQDTPGVTRDRIYADCEWLDRKFTLIDTGGMEIGSEEIIQRQIIQQAQIAIETADVALMQDDISKLPYLLALSHKTMGIITQNITVAIAVKLICVVLAILGIITLMMSVGFGDLGLTLLVIMNSFRIGMVKDPLF